MTVPDTIALGNVQFFKKVIMAFIAAAKLLQKSDLTSAIRPHSHPRPHRSQILMFKKIGVVLVGNSWIMRNFVGSNDDAH